MAMRDKIDRTINKALVEVETLEKLFANNGAFENAVAEIGGDISWFGDVRENLKQLFSNIEELHMGAVGHLDEGRMSDMLIHDSETMSKEEFAKKHGKDVADEYYEASIGAPDYNPAAGKYTDNMVEKVFLNAEDGGIKVTVNDKEVGYASEPKELAQILGSLGVDENTSIMHSSDVDFASEEGFESDGAAHEFIDAALEMMGINENKDLAMLRKLAGI